MLLATLVKPLLLTRDMSAVFRLERSIPYSRSKNLEDLRNASGDGEGGGGSREDYSAEDVEYYFNYSGILAERGSYDQLEDLLECEFSSFSHATCTWLGYSSQLNSGLHLRRMKVEAPAHLLFPDGAYIESCL